MKLADFSYNIFLILFDTPISGLKTDQTRAISMSVSCPFEGSVVHQAELPAVKGAGLAA